MFECYPDILTCTQICDMLSISKSTLYRLINAGEIGYYQIRGRKMYRKTDAIHYLERNYNSVHEVIEMVE